MNKKETYGRGPGVSEWTPEGGETITGLNYNGKTTTQEPKLPSETDIEDLQALESTKLDFRFWKKKAEEYNFGQGELLTSSRIVFPNLENYPKCRGVVSDWTKCKTINKWATWTGICSHLKEQVGMCINDTWVERQTFRNRMTDNVWRQQQMVMSQTASKAAYDRRFYGMMVDDHDTD
eukprot:TRINITY_DN867_c14_g1_i1.p1 TRINITY_DN867_c14_g1~~TRINITY_DN867_c14_g1_i1.p1  ORF type:complete len:178 (+),score=22.47 TRINITY_DN867_c14_g1_i1:30-563(+)